MKVLLDENLPHRLRHEIVGHEVFTVRYMGWKGIKNGELLDFAIASGFEAFLTVDDGIPHEQNLKSRPIHILVLHAISNAFEDLHPLCVDLQRQLDLAHLAKPPQVIHIRKS